jgi:hypothetical protein
VCFDEVLETFSSFLEEGSIRFAVIDGLALQAWGHSRFTRDLGFVVERSARDVIVEFAEGRGFETLHVSEGYSNHLHTDAGLGRVDFMYVDSHTADQLFSSSTRQAVVGEISAPIPAPHHLIAMKALAIKNSPGRRFSDAQDVRFLLTFPGVDRELVRDYFARHGLLDLFDDIART